MTVTEASGATFVSEGGSTDTYTVELDTQPTFDVTVSFNTGKQIQPISAIAFTSVNWSAPQTVTATAVDDLIVESSPHSGTINHSASGAVEYDGIGIAGVTANITDNDSRSVPETPTLSRAALFALALLLADAGFAATVGRRHTYHRAGGRTG